MKMADIGFPSGDQKDVCTIESNSRTFPSANFTLIIFGLGLHLHGTYPHSGQGSCGSDSHTQGVLKHFSHCLGYGFG